MKFGIDDFYESLSRNGNLIKVGKKKYLELFMKIQVRFFFTKSKVYQAVKER